MGIKETFSQSVVLPLMRSRLGFWQKVCPFYDEGLRTRAAIELMSQAQREAWVLHELRALVRFAGARVPFYRERFRQIGFNPDSNFDFDDYAQIPPLEKADVLESADAMLPEGDNRSRFYQDATGGSTGVPVKIWKDTAEKGWGLSGVEFFEGRVGAGEGRRISRIWGHHLDLQGQDSLRKRARLWLTNVQYLDCFRLSPAVFSSWHSVLSRRQPEALVCYASAIYLFADWLREQGIRPTYPSHAIITGAEKLWPAQREVVRAVFGVPIHERYGGRDVGLIAFQTDSESPVLTVDMANILVEPATTGEQVGEAYDVLVTKLHAFGMPLLRYRNGDMARFPNDAQPGHPTAELLDVTGRTMDRVVASDGRIVHAAQFPHMFKEFDIKLYQVRQSRDGSVNILIVPGPGFDAASQERINRLTRANLGATPLRISLVDQIDRTSAGKLRPVVSEAETPNWQTPAAAAAAPDTRSRGEL